MNFIFIS